MKIFISGASGLVGGNCLRYFNQQGANAVGSYFSFPAEGTIFFDTLHPDDPNNFDLSGFKPDVIVHCGALTHVDYCEDHEEESFEKTVQSTQNLVTLSQQLGARLVYISTDYVFDGQSGPYHEEEPVRPLSVYARHKLEAEQYVLQQMADQGLVLRITNVYGREVRNKNFVSRIIEQCMSAQKLTLKLPVDQYATPVNAWDVARAMFLLLRDGKSGIYHIASTDWMNRVELALTVLKYFPDAEYDLFPMRTPDLHQPADRPLLGGLLKTKFSGLYPEFLFSNVDDFVRDCLKQKA